VVPPGKYQVKLSVGEWSSTQPLEVLPDPRKQIAPEDFAAQYRVARTAWEQLSRTHRAIQRLRDVRTQVEGIAKRMKDAGMGDNVADASKALIAKLEAVENKLHQPKSQASQDILNFPPQIDDQIGNLLGSVASAERAPTKATEERLAELQKQLDGYIGELDAVLATDLPAFEKLVRDKQAPVVIVPKDEPAGTK
jgi:hypothetical protein